MTIVVDSSALLAFVQNEPGASVVEEALNDGAVCAAVNWSEVAQKVRAAQRNWDLVRALLLSYGVRVEPVGESDAEDAALRWKRGSGLSIADRCCLAVAERLDASVLTADAEWGSAGRVRQIR